MKAEGLKERDIAKLEAYTLKKEHFGRKKTLKKRKKKEEEKELAKQQKLETDIV
eukprot:CAMPEP_0202960674 /NCGR_PEP_ID=MMETSP1396-20130829/4823_1 /ASSEMBLY_ACC=CAM_ASM_000872 /TAXON_ID= /ORGANISM="Pseudokeronopsis sp., Strain Brazil" /LENGTH=53 /DNA_ID=CAMNT_0049680041 /DNA_START=568 /DNA_END=729 /DNA_ORIENTATION=-